MGFPTSRIPRLALWYFELFPLVIVVYEADKDRAFWMHVQDYIDRNPNLMESDADTVTLRIPTHNKLNLYAIDRFRKLSLDCVSTFRKGFEDRQ